VTGIGRAFIAVVPPVDVLDAIEAGVAPLRSTRPGARWTSREQWHITAQFLGRVAETDELLAALRGALEAPPAFSLRLGGAGAFPNPRRASVVWVGVRDGEEALASVAGAVHAATKMLGFASELHTFRPHVTLARLAKPGPVGDLVARLTDVDLGRAWDLEEVVLFESRTRPSGAEYEERGRVPTRTT
jgi:2'-5' RNA ligase